MGIETDLNTPPYWDDYDESKKFYRVLFRPKMAVQARELTQLQSILQNQIERFGNHVFKDGSIVEGCNPALLPNLSFVRVADDFSNTTYSPTDFAKNTLLVGATSNVRAAVIISKDGLLSSYPDTNRFYVKYITTGVNNAITFASGETISIYSENQNKLGILDANNRIANVSVLTTNATINAVGTGYGMSIEDGIAYHKGFFQFVDEQTIIVKDYDQNTANYVVGFETTEEIITPEQDPSLNDNSLGYSNENAPGAHRLKLTPKIVAKDRQAIANNEAFFAIFEFSNISNDLVLNRDKTPYNVVEEVLAGRTYDESGDYVTKPFITESVAGSNSSTFAYQVSAGKGYIHGHQIEYLAARKIETDRAVTTTEAPQQIITANYGNYVYAKEYSGIFDTAEFVTVSIYDAAQLSITNRSLAGGVVTGNNIGTAKIKAVIHDEGDPGLPNTTYRLYLTEITMNSGKSFSKDAKAIYMSGTYGKAFADIVMTDGKAVLEESGKSTLLFPFGKKALKTLRSSNGTINRTEFYFRATSNATLQTNGYISVTTNSPYAGGTEALGYSTGILGDTLEKEFLVVVTANVSTANITGTINLNSTNTTVITSGLNSHFANGEFIRINANSSVIDYRRVVSVNSTAMVLDATPSATNTAANFGKHFPAGYTFPLDATYPGSRNVNITSSTTFDINTGAGSSAALTSTAPVTVQYRMIRTQARQIKKDLKKNVYVKLTANTASNNTWNLGLPDVLRINAVYANSSTYSEVGLDVTNRFTFDSGQKNDYYDHGKLILKPQFVGSLGVNDYLVVKLDHFVANTSAGIGFFSVDSYPIDDANTANTTAIQTAQIPVYDTGDTIIDLRDCVDFRAVKANTANSAATLAAATVNPGTTTTFITNAAKYTVEPDTNFQADIEYYLGRVDLVTINTTGGLGVIKGLPAEEPKTPKNDSDTMILATATVPPYPTLTVKEAETYKRIDYVVRTKLATNRVYTMKDVGVLDKRIERLEYYTTLNQLEQKAQNIQVPDENGINRFKNGIFADPMSSHIYAQTTDFEYAWSIDSELGHGRPMFSSENIDLTYNSSNSSGVQVTGRFITRPYTHELFIYQPFATKFRNNTQDIWAWQGSVELYPPYDMNRDETRLPNIDTTLDLTQPFMDFANAVSQATGATIFGTRFGDWRTTSSSQSGRVITQQQERNNVNTFIVPITQTIDLGTYVTDISVQPYIKSRLVAFIARSLKPNTRIYAYFDDEPVSVHCAPAELNTSLGANLQAVVEAASATGRPDNVCRRTGTFGAPLVTDANGTLYGVFRIPEGQFRVGDRQFQLLDTDSLITGKDAALARAHSIFTASSIAISTRNATISAIQPRVNQIAFTDTRTVTVTLPPPVEEPIAQSFKVEVPGEQSGVFVTKIDLFFKSKDPVLGIKVVLVGTTNGVPNSTLVYGTSRVASADVNVSDDSSAATTFTFKEPIFLSAYEEYAFYVEPEGGSPEYRMWMSETGQFDVLTGAQIYLNPFTGDAFRSSNARTWTVLVKEDIKFNLYVANFTVGTGTAHFDKEDDDYFTYTGLSLSNSQITVGVGDTVLRVNSSSNVAVTNSTVTGTIQFIDTTNAKITLNGSTGGFANSTTYGIFRLPQQGNTAQANTTTCIGTFNLASIDNKPLQAIVPRFATMVPMNTSLDFSFAGTSNTGVFDTTYHAIALDTEREMSDYERTVFSKTNEAGVGVNKTLRIKASLTTSNKYISPVIDMARKSALVINNIINNTSTNEHTRYGSAIAKYVSKPIILADGQEAEDLRVYVSGYRPINTDIEVYVKFLNQEDKDFFNNKDWTKLENQSPALRSSPIDKLDFKEFEYLVPFVSPTTYAARRNASNFNIIEYTDASGAIYQTYKTFAIKIVLLSANKVYIPKVNDIRGICLQV